MLGGLITYRNVYVLSSKKPTLFFFFKLLLLAFLLMGENTESHKTAKITT